MSSVAVGADFHETYVVKQPFTKNSPKRTSTFYVICLPEDDPLSSKRTCGRYCEQLNLVVVHFVGLHCVTSKLSDCVHCFGDCRVSQDCKRHDEL